MKHEDAKDTKEKTWVEGDLSYAVIGAALRVHREFGPGLLESVYEKCLAFELRANGHKVERQVPVPLIFRGLQIDCSYRADLIVDDRLLVEVKAVESLENIHLAQVLTYLRLTGLQVGVLLNFNVTTLRKGIKRVVRGEFPSCPSRLRVSFRGEFREPSQLEGRPGSG